MVAKKDFPGNMLPGKSWIFSEPSSTWKVVEYEFGPGKSWNSLVVQLDLYFCSCLLKRSDIEFELFGDDHYAMYCTVALCTSSK